MAMQHCAFFKLNRAKLAQEFPGNSLHEAFETMRKAGIPGLLEFNVSMKNPMPWEGYQDCSNGYTLGFVSRHMDAKALQIYADHPAHKVLQVRLFKCLEAPPFRMELMYNPPTLQ